MKRSLLVCSLAVVLSLMLGACATLIEGEYEEVTIHTEDPSGEEQDHDAEIISVGNDSALKNAIINMVQNRTESATLRLENYDSAVAADILYQAISEVQNTPLGAYAVKHISDSNPVQLSYYQVDLKILYKRTQEEMDSIVTVNTQEAAENKILEVVEENGSYVAIMGPAAIASESVVSNLFERYYYSSPLSVVSLPAVTSTVYPNTGSSRILELQFEYALTLEEKTQMVTALADAVAVVAADITAQSEAGKLLNVCRSLADRITYDTETQEEEREDLSQNPAGYTAYDALVNGTAVSEGYAMALKAVCDQVGFECTIVQGRHNEARHVWNIVKIDEEYYHVDPMLCDTVGFENAFLLRDSDLTGHYWWDTGAYVNCEGHLTYYDLIPKIVPTDSQEEVSASESEQETDFISNGQNAE